MAFFLSLGIVGFFLIYFLLNIFLWKKTRSPAILLVQGIVYLYTFHGYLLAYLGERFSYISSKVGYFQGYPFHANFDSYFYLSLFYQLIFAILFLGVFSLFFQRMDKEEGEKKIIEIDFRKFAFLTTVILAANIYFWRKEFFGFILNRDLSYYLSKATDSMIQGYSISKLSLNFLSMILFLLVFVILGFNKNFRSKNFSYNNYLFSWIFILLGIFFVLSLSLGDRLSLAVGVFFAFSLVLFDRKISFKRGVRIFVLLLLIFLLINSIRLARTDIAKESLGDTMGERVFSYFFDLIITGEAHPTFSLNAILKGNVERFNGGSLKHALFVFIPRFIIDDRPVAGYEYMAEKLDLDEFTWWGIHYSADWYLNFGVFGIIIGSVLLGLILGMPYRLALKSIRWRFIFSGMISILPLFFRNDGMADYKNLIYYGLLGFLAYFVISWKSDFQKSFLSK